MSDTKNKISRRSFINKASAGAVGSYFLLSNLSAKPVIDTEEKFLPGETKENTVALKLVVNGHKIKTRVKPETTLVQLIREKLELTGTKIVCNQGECGGCTVLLDDKAIYSCHFLALDAAGKNVTTIEGLLNGDKLSPLQQAFIDNDGLQCGFCTPGQIMSAYALLKANPSPSEEEIKLAMAGNLCRCGAYPNIVKSVSAAANKI